MSYRIPTEDTLIEVISEVMEEHQMFTSQRRFSAAVSETLRRRDPEARVSPERVRRIAILNGLVRLEIHAADTEERSRYRRCPVCSSKMRRLKNMTIYDGTVTNGYRCTVCPYWTGMRKRVPNRYVFHVEEVDGR